MTHATAAPRVSVLVTVYNREEYLATCLDSILASTWSDFEVIVADDASSDGSAAIADEYARSDQRVRVARNERNLGDYPNRAFTASLARGTYLKYVDSDDLIYPHSLAIMVEAMEASPDAGLGLSHSLPEDDEPYPWTLSPAQAWRKQFLGDGCMGCGPSGAIIRRDAFSAVGGFGEWGVLTDTDLWFRMAARWPIVLLPPGLVWWRRHSGQEFNRDDSAFTYIDKGYELAAASLASSDNPLEPHETAAAMTRLKHQHARRLIGLASRGMSPRASLELARKAGLSAADILKGLRGYPGP